MVRFWPGSEDGAAPVDLRGSTLVMPSVTIGNVGQLAVDLLVNTLNMKRVGFLESKYVLPSLGNDAFAKPGTGELAVEMELYGTSAGEVYVLQQRSPVIAGCQRRFATEVVEWVKDIGFGKVLVLASIDAGFRKDSSIMGAQLRYIWTGAGEDEGCAAMGLQVLDASEAADGSDTKERRTAPWPLVQQSREAGVPLTFLCVFASEGDNVPDALHMASAVSQYLSLIPDSERASFKWKPPGSWCNLYGPPASDMLY